MQEEELDAFVGDGGTEEEVETEGTGEAEATGEGETGGEEEGESWTKAAALDERRKRQAKEQENQELRERLAFLEGQKAAKSQSTEEEQDEPVDIDWGDPEGSIDRLAEKKLEAREKAKAKQAKQEWDDLVADCAADAAAKYEDYQDVISHWNQLEQDNPRLLKRLHRQPDPVEWAYQYAKKDMSKGDKLSQLERENAELKAKLEQGGGQLPKGKKTIAGARGTGSRAAASILTPDDVFKEAFGGR